MSIVTRFVVGFILVALGAAVVAGAGIRGFDVMGGAAGRVAQASTTLLQVGEVRAAALGVRRFEKDFIINAGDDKAQAKYEQEWRQELEVLRAGLATLKKGLAAEQLAGLEAAGGAVDRYGRGFEGVMASARADRALPPRELNRLLAPVKDEIRTVIAALAALSAQEVKAAAENAARVEGAEAQGRRTLWGGVGGLVLAMAVAIWLILGGFRALAASVAALTGSALRLSEAVDRGELTARADVAAVSPEFQPVLEGLNRTMEAFTNPIAMASSSLQLISQGQIPPRVETKYRGDFKEICQSVNRCSAAVGRLVADAGRVAEGAARGSLSLRADPAGHLGEFRRVVEGLNQALDAVTGPTRQAADAIGRISRGELPEPITAAWPGDFAALKESLNQCIAAVRALLEDAASLARGAAEGRLTARAGAARHQGDFRRIVEGVNATLEAVVAPLQAASAALDRISHGDIPPPLTQAWPGDFALLRDSLNRSIASINAMASDAASLAKAAREGHLSVRAGVERHQGDFRQIVAGMNETFDALDAPIQEATRVLSRMAARDITERIEVVFQGEHAVLVNAVNGTATALGTALDQVSVAVQQVSTAADEISASSHSVAQGASAQAGEVERVNGRLEVIAGEIRGASSAAAQADRLTVQAQQVAGRGTAAMDGLNVAMGRIRSSAEGTSQIIRDINDIAFQTNLLALNAAVEAARAGEAGRGFAVVAEEVRSLALRSKEAAQKTEVLIRESVQQAGGGEETARQVGAMLGEITRHVNGVTEVIAAIAASAKQQTTSMEEVGRAVSEVDRVMQQTAASAEESSSAAMELNGQAEELGAMISTFRLRAEEGTSRWAGAGPRRALQPGQGPRGAA